MHPHELGKTAQVASLISQVVQRAVPQSPALMKLEKYKRAPATSYSHRYMVQAGFLLGVDKFELYVSKDAPNLLTVSDTKPPLIVLGADMMFGEENVRRFALGKVCARIRRSRNRLAEASPQVLRRWVETLTYSYYPDFVVEGADPESLGAFAESLSSGVMPHLRKEIEQAVAMVRAEGGKLDYERFLGGIRHTENRLGLLLSGDMAAPALTMLYINRGAPPPARPRTPEEAAQNFGGDIEIAEMLSFLISEEHFELRRLIGATLAG